MKLAMMIFGNGGGMKEPYFDGVFYWLNDSNGSPARFYKFTGGFGAQLTSFEFRAPKAGTCRTLADREYVVFNTSSGWFGLMHQVTWAAVRLPQGTAELNAAIRGIKSELQRL